MKQFIQLFALLICLAAALFYCTRSNATVCYNQAIADGDGCDVYAPTE